MTGKERKGSHHGWTELAVPAPGDSRDVRGVELAARLQDGFDSGR